MRVVVTGADGFLGWHTRVRLRATYDHHVIAVTRKNWPQLPELVVGADAVIHIAGLNRATDQELECGNRQLAEDIRAAVLVSGGRPRLVYANSVRSGDGTPYGDGKAAASDVLRDLSKVLGTAYTDIHLPNLFGEHGRPHYNSFVATFVESVVTGQPVSVDDRSIRLLHVQQAAQQLIDALTGIDSGGGPLGTQTSVAEVHQLLLMLHGCYAVGEIPPLGTEFDVDLFNTMRAAMFPTQYPIALNSRSDARGSLVEVVRAHGSPGQTFISSTRPGAVRGEHFHLRKVERFVVIDGTAQITLRRMLTDETVTFDVDGRQPCLVDMPTMWTHRLLNTGSADLTTIFWTNELFDADRPDTYAEPVLVDSRLPTPEMAH